MFKHERIMLCDMDSGECVTVDKINRSSVKALRGWATRIVRIFPNAELKVINAADENVRKYFEAYFKKLNERE